MKNLLLCAICFVLCCSLSACGADGLTDIDAGEDALKNRLIYGPGFDPNADNSAYTINGEKLTNLLDNNDPGQPDEIQHINVPSFSYEEIKQIYKENDPGVKCDGFYNTSEAEVTTLQQVIDRAKNECTIEYDTTDVFYDNVAGIWKVVISTAGTLGGCQTVYLDNKGLTCLVIYGE